MVNQNNIFSFKIKRQAKNLFPSDVERTVELVNANNVLRIGYPYVRHNIEPQWDQMSLLIRAPNEDSNQSTHPRSLIRAFVVRKEELCVLGYPKCAQPRFCSDCANAQADLNLRWAHMSEGTFPGIVNHIGFLAGRDPLFSRHGGGINV